MKRYICLHAHLYQPPRENPWLEEVELQDSAYPFHDWNARVTAECYAPNTASRILDDERHIIDIVNNYSKISFNFGPTLLSWMERHQPDVYRAVLEANRKGKERYGGHPPAIAQVYNHLIMPLANSRDKRTQIRWGIRDYETRFGGKPEGIWLAETAVDTETLELCAAEGIKFTILAPRQAGRVRPLDNGDWQDLPNDSIDPKRAYQCNLPSGNSIALFFYDGPIAQDVAFGGVLDDGKHFAERLMGAFADNGDDPQLVHVATDGETYGHHHRFGDMALAYCLYDIDSHDVADLTIYGQFLADHPPAWEVEIKENSSWSCVHGVERWRADCGCSTGGHPGWQQQWRAPLREAMDTLRDRLAEIYEQHSAALLNDPWAARDEYIGVILDRSRTSVDTFFKNHAKTDLSDADRTSALKLLEMQRHAMLMYTSCGWFFDEISGIETTQVIAYAARAMQLAQDIAGEDLVPDFVKALEQAPSNVDRYQSGAGVYEKSVKPEILDMLRVGAHYAVASLFEEKHGDITDIYAFRAESDTFDRLELGRQRVAIGRAKIRSIITGEQSQMHFAVLHLGEQNLMGGVRREMDDAEFEEVRTKITDAFKRGNIADVITLTDEHLGTHNYSLWHLFKDEQRAVMQQILESPLTEIEQMFRQIYQRHYPIMQATADMDIPLPAALSTTVSHVLNTDIRNAVTADEPDLDRLEELTAEARRWKIDYDATTLSFEAGERCDLLMEQLERSPDDLGLLGTLEGLLRIFHDLPVSLNIWRAQNVYFAMGKELYHDKKQAADTGNKEAAEWIDLFDRLGSYLQVRMQ